METYQSKSTIKEWAEDDRPREKLLLKGRNALSDAELLAIIIGSGVPDRSALDLARDILELANNNLVELGKLQVKDLQKIKGIGEARAVTVIAAVELGARRRAAEGMTKLQVTSSKQAADIFQAILGDLAYEEFWILLLNRAQKVMGKHLISRGGITGTVADIRLIFKKAIEYNACNLIVCHNHPSGNLKASEEDKRLTKKIAEAGKIMDIPLLDHIIITDTNYFSFADQGLL